MTWPSRNRLIFLPISSAAVKRTIPDRSSVPAFEVLHTGVNQTGRTASIRTDTLPHAETVLERQIDR